MWIYLLVGCKVWENKRHWAGKGHGAGKKGMALRKRGMARRHAKRGWGKHYAGILSTPADFPFSVMLLQSQIPDKELVIDLLGAGCSLELHCHHNSHCCVVQSNLLTIC